MKRLGHQRCASHCHINCLFNILSQWTTKQTVKVVHYWSFMRESTCGGFSAKGPVTQKAFPWHGIMILWNVLITKKKMFGICSKLFPWLSAKKILIFMCLIIHLTNHPSLFLTLGLFGRRVIVVTCVCPSVRLSVCPSVCLSVCSHHPC